MRQNITIRKEQPDDIDSITEVTRAAFKNHPISQHTEEFIIHALRAAGVLTVSLIAEINDKIVGHIAFSPVTLSDGSKDWYGLGPVSVLPEFQRQGIGKTLIHEGISRLKKVGMQGCALVGDPEYYKMFGFRNNPELVHEGIPQEYFLVLQIGGNTPHGFMTFHKGFSAKGES